MWVLVLDRVEAVRTDRDHGLDVVGLHGLDVLLCEYLVEVLVAHTPRRVARARLLVSEDREVHARPLEYGSHRPRDALAALLQRSGASHPEQHVRVRVVGERRHVQALCPVGTRVGGAAPRVPALLHAQQRAHSRLRHRSLLHDQEPAHIDYRVHVLHADRTLLDARAAREAVP